MPRYRGAPGAVRALERAERDLRDTTIEARFDGSLQEVKLVEGRLVSANEKLAELVDPDLLEVAFRVSTAQYARLIDAGGALLPLPVTVALDVMGAEIVAEGIACARAGAAIVHVHARDPDTGLASAIRVFVLAHYRDLAGRSGQ